MPLKLPTAHLDIAIARSLISSQKMPQKISYSVTSALLVLLVLLGHPNLCHTAREGSHCLCPDTNLSKNSSVNEGRVLGIRVPGIPFMKRSYGSCDSRRTIISGKPMNILLVAAASIALSGSTVALFAYLCLKLLNVSEMEMILVASTLNSAAMYDFDEHDHIMSRRRIRAHGD